MDNWLTFSNPNLFFALNYPDPTPQGYLVRIHEKPGEAGYRVHFLSEEGDEVYFEVGRYLDLPAPQAIKAFFKDVSGRIKGLETSPLEEIEFAACPAYRFSMRWPGKRRVVLFIERDDALYRIIYDPLSSLNRQMLESFTFV